jgi:membrane AbrB-like protein
MTLVLLLAAAAAVGLLFDRLGVPGGLIVGSMVGAAAVSLVRGGEEVPVPEPLLTGAYLLLGAGIGATVTRGVLVSLRASLLPAVLSAVLIILAGVAIAAVLGALGIAPPGAVLATSPGALTAISAAAAERGTGAAEVALFHTVRIVLVLLTLPALLTLVPTAPD